MMADLVKSFLNGMRLLETGMLASLFVNATLAKFGNSLPRTMFLGEVPKGRRSQCQNTVGRVLKRFTCFLRRLLELSTTSLWQFLSPKPAF
ncbi:hypothetical protein DPMN_111818 [Dreissena polymorpha]|uniref:Uncharacterized protein n=1 Tax=Dreissena polymorpha TaxID=45954 RepID=A0A9D4QPC7_DREPO|nr:hypothetical protein DPMN_111818 [Dreissena polymorpha]